MWPLLQLWLLAVVWVCICVIVTHIYYMYFILLLCCDAKRTFFCHFQFHCCFIVCHKINIWSFLFVLPFVWMLYVCGDCSFPSSALLLPFSLDPFSILHKQRTHMYTYIRDGFMYLFHLLLQPVCRLKKNQSTSNRVECYAIMKFTLDVIVFIWIMIFQMKFNVIVLVLLNSLYRS